MGRFATTYIDTMVESRPAVRLCLAPHPRGFAPRSGEAAVIGPETRIVDTVSRARGVAETRGGGER